MRFPAGCGEPYLLYISDGSASISLLRAQRKIPAVRGPSEHWIAFRNDPLSGKTGLQWPPAAHWC